MKKLSYEEASFVRRLNQLLEKNGKTKTELAAAIAKAKPEKPVGEVKKYRLRKGTGLLCKVFA